MGEKPPVDKLVFGKTMTDHMLTCKWSETEGWGKPLIEPVRQVDPEYEIPIRLPMNG